MRGADPPRPDGDGSADVLIEQLRSLRAWAGVSYRDIHRAVVRDRRQRGAVELPALNTVYRSFQPGRVRLDADLVVDIARVLLPEGASLEEWRQACRLVAGIADAGSMVRIVDRVPSDLPNFVGRAEQVSRMLASVAQAGQRATAITGMPGVGKSSLAVHLVHRLLSARPATTVAMVDLRGFDPDQPPVSPAAVLDALLRGLDVQPERSARLDLAGRARLFERLLRGRQVLLVLDNAASSAQVEPLLCASAECITLVTSRDSLADLHGVERFALDVFTRRESVSLLADEAAAGGVTPDSEALGRIAELTGDLPLVVSLVGARIRQARGWTLADHQQRLAQHRTNLRLESAVEAALQLSYDHLDPAARRVLRYASLHPGGDLEPFALAALTGADLADTRSRLDRLTATHLIRPDGSGRFRLHDVIRLYAMARTLDEDPAAERDAAMQRLQDHYAHAAWTAMARRVASPDDLDAPPAAPGPPDHTFTDYDAAESWMNAERVNLVAVAKHAAENGRPSHTTQQALTLTPHLIAEGRAQDIETLNWYALTLDASAKRSMVLRNLSGAYWRLGRHQEAIERAEEALAAAERDRDPSATSKALTSLGVYYWDTGDRVRAHAATTRSLDLLRGLGSEVRVGRLLNNLGLMCAKSGEYEDSARYLAEALDIARRCGERSLEGVALSSLGCLQRALGNHERDLELQRQALAIADELNHRHQQADVLNEIGNALRGLNRHAEAIESHNAALTLAHDLADQAQIGYAHDGIARALTASGRTDLAGDHYQQALHIYTSLAMPEAAEIQAEFDVRSLS